MHRLLLANAVAQAEAFCVGRTEKDVRQEMERSGASAADVDRIAPHRRPSLGAALLIFSCTGRGCAVTRGVDCGLRTQDFLEGVLWNVFSFDQWGVELGKVLANQLLKDGESASWTPGTQALLGRL